VKPAFELSVLDLETISAGAEKQQAPVLPPGTPPPTGFIANVVAWKRSVGMPVLIPGV